MCEKQYSYSLCVHSMLVRPLCVRKFVHIEHANASLPGCPCAYHALFVPSREDACAKTPGFFHVSALNTEKNSSLFADGNQASFSTSHSLNECDGSPSHGVHFQQYLMFVVYLNISYRLTSFDTCLGFAQGV